ncbi:MAG: LLM class flavin-dependent oxidoreductase [Actinomycetia bacterium]|nr:LLM class flavin-dependent oxidoreductase [Actinomycetes bacterium]MCP4960760.1 LLM class flavin-dependent oxidoreductase [Actinomycetes bacterium]
MRIGVLLIPTDPWDETVSAAQRLESLGYDHVWVYDHLTWRHYQDLPWHATYPWLAGLAASTQRIRLGTMVSNLNIRHPLTLAKDAMTIDHISSGRITLGLGAGGGGFDATVLGQPPFTPTQRIDRLSEAAYLLDGLLTGAIQNHAGTFYELNEARLLPGCIQNPRLPIAIAAGGRRALRIAAEHADAWITFGDTSGNDLSSDGTEHIVAQQARRFEDHCIEFGRDPSAIDRIYLIGNTEARPLASLAAFEDFVGRYTELGFTDLVFHMPRDDNPAWDDPPAIVAAIADRFLG